MSPREWLSWVRGQHGYTADFSWTSSLDDFLSRLPAESRADAQRIWQDRVGRSISDIHDDLMGDYLEPLRVVLTTPEREIADRVFFGVFPTGDFEAYAGFTPRGDQVVIVHEGLAHTLVMWAHWFLRCFEMGGLEHIASRPDTQLDFLEYLVSVWHGQPDPTRQLPDVYPSTSDGWRLSHAMCMAAIIFVLGHEMGHVLKGHPGYTADTARNHSQEFEADQVGAGVVLRYALFHSLPYDDTYFTKFMLFAPYLALACIGLFSDRDSDTHPSVSQRRRAITAFYPEAVASLFGKEADTFYDQLDRDVIELLDRNGENLLEVTSVFRDIVSSIERAYALWDRSWTSWLRTNPRQ